jgi:hypothetical protein
MRGTLSSLFAFASLLSAYGTAETAAEPRGPAIGSFGVGLANMDTTVAAREDFSSYVNGPVMR